MACTNLLTVAPCEAASSSATFLSVLAGCHHFLSAEHLTSVAEKSRGPLVMLCVQTKDDSLISVPIQICIRFPLRRHLVPRHTTLWKVATAQHARKCCVAMNHDPVSDLEEGLGSFWNTADLCYVSILAKSPEKSVLKRADWAICSI